MSTFYLDSSALIKRYLTEIGSAWVSALTDPPARHTIVLAEITRVEIAAAFAARHRAPSGISRQERDDAVDLLLKHCDTEYHMTSLSRAIVSRAVRNYSPLPLRVLASLRLCSGQALRSIPAATVRRAPWR